MLRLVRFNFKKLHVALALIIFPLSKYFYDQCINISLIAFWAYEKNLELIYRQRSLDVIKYSRLFLKYYNKYKEINPKCVLQWRVKVCACYLLLHDIDKLQNTAQEYIDTQKSLISDNNLAELGIRIITENIFEYYNVHAYLDTHVKAMKLGWQTNYKLILLSSKDRVKLNPVMFEYWKKYITIIDDAEADIQLHKLRKYLETDTGMTTELNGRAVYIEHAKGIVQKEWEKQNRQPLFDLDEEDVQFGKELLSSIGIPINAWFVCLHVRDAGYKTGSYLNQETFDSYRNADIDSYIPAIEEIVKRGGYVIRVGDPNMKPIDAMTGLFDYAHSDIRSNRMDIFLFSQCRFFTGVSSGPILTPILFGVPVIMTNFVPMSGRPHAGNCLFIPKMLWLKNEERYASFLEVLSSDMSRIFTAEGYAKRNINLVDNSEEELRDVVIEMLQKLDGDISYTDEDESRQNLITGLYQQYSGYGDMGRIGNAFIKKYAEQGLLKI